PPGSWRSAARRSVVVSASSCPSLRVAYDWVAYNACFRRLQVASADHPNHSLSVGRENDKRNARTARVALLLRSRSPMGRGEKESLLEEAHAGFFAVEPDALAAPMGGAGRRQQQEEIAHVDIVDRAPDGQLGAGIGDVADAAVALPAAVDR